MGKPGSKKQMEILDQVDNRERIQPNAIELEINVQSKDWQV